MIMVEPLEPGRENVAAHPPPTPENPRVAAIAAGLWIGAVMLLIQSVSPHLSGEDAYYHIRMALMLPSVGFTSEFPWLFWTDLNHGFINHYYGFHALLSPAVSLADRLLGEPLVGAKAFSVLVMFGIGAVLSAIIRQRNIPVAHLWVFLLILAPWPFWVRMSFIRAPAPNLLLLLAGLFLALRRNALGVGIVAFAATHLYSGGLFFAAIPGALVAGQLLTGSGDRRVFRVFGATVAGVVCGLATSPYFPRNIKFLAQEAMNMVVGPIVHAGSEWQPYTTWFLVVSTAAYSLLWLLGLTIALRTGRKLDADSIALLLLQAGFLVLTCKSRHFIEYWPAFALVHIADLLGKPLGELLARGRWGQRPKVLAATLAISACALLSVPGLRSVLTEARPAHPHGEIRRAMAVLRTTSSPGDLVFTDDWDLFPVLFYYNQHNYYAMGLDPVYTSRPYPDLQRRFSAISEGRAAETQIGEAQGAEAPPSLGDIRDRFKASYVLVMNDHPAMYRQVLRRRDLFTMIYPAWAAADIADRPQPTVALFAVSGGG